MAQRFKDIGMSERGEIKWVVISGPESTGKTELAKDLANRSGTIWVPEYAREYIENLNRPYTYTDIEQIARCQETQEKTYGSKLAKGLLFFDTWFIITKVWFEQVFGHCPEWIITHIQSAKIELFLVCNTDLPWVADNVRENGGERREQLFQLYCKEISSFGFKYEIITGIGKERVDNAFKALTLNGLR
jgi:NadR type nicotinamide-nucleotide adenylyltransferase